MRFIFFDRVIELERGRRIVANKLVSLDGAYFTRHYRRKPVFPPTLIVESIAQAAGWLNFMTHGEAIRTVVALVEGVRFGTPVGPGTVLMLEANIQFLHPGGVTMTGRATLGQAVAATIERIVFANRNIDPAELTPKERAHFDYIKAGTEQPC